MDFRLIAAARAATRAAPFVLTLAVGFLAAAPAHAQPACAGRDEFVRALQSQYGEGPVAAGLAGERIVVEVFATPDGASWTILVTRPDGISCVILAGEDWHPVPRPAGDQT